MKRGFHILTQKANLSLEKQFLINTMSHWGLQLTFGRVKLPFNQHLSWHISDILQKVKALYRHDQINWCSGLEPSVWAHEPEELGQLTTTLSLLNQVHRRARRLLSCFPLGFGLGLSIFKVIFIWCALTLPHWIFGSITECLKSTALGIHSFLN